ncbi:MAG: S-adenosyl-l-methionine hydroxide adenosyltransferase family protein [Bdellovibrionaceae bacterium]|nr:S-adenosyl-l-methionine hydroxide adenosyltransferase family protein [Pseudobdellovibrionaceae bacterium]
MKPSFFSILLASCLMVNPLALAKSLLVLQTDFGLKDGAVSAMKGVIFQVDDNLKVSDLTHEIPAFNTWEASYRLMQVMPYWKKGTVFVSVVDPGVGSSRKSVVAKLKTGHLIVTPDNGTLTHLAQKFGIEEVRQIDEKKMRIKGSTLSHTFHGRDVYAYTGAMLASEKTPFDKVGPAVKDDLVKLDFTQATWSEGVLSGNIPVLDPQYGNVWTNISNDLADKMNLNVGELYRVQIFNQQRLVYNRVIPFARTFGDVTVGEDLIYLNSLLDLALAVNQGNFAKMRGIESGSDWTVKISRP